MNDQSYNAKGYLHATLAIGKDTVKFAESVWLTITNKDLNILQLSQWVGAINGEFSINTSHFSWHIDNDPVWVEFRVAIITVPEKIVSYM